MKIVIAGASGFLGGRLIKKLKGEGHHLTQLVRSGTTAADQALWDPDAGTLDPHLLEGVDAIVNLCGVGVGDKRWNSRYPDLIRTSRVDPSKLLARTSASVGVPVLVNASAVGYYGPCGDELIDETAAAGRSFLAGVCVDWERATSTAQESGTRVVHLRTGLVLGKESGLLPQLTLITKLFAGGKLGSGKQYFPWISATDHVEAMVHLLTADVSGPVNMTAPTPVTNAEFTRELGHQLHRPTPWKVPTFALQIVVGDFAQEIVTGQRAVPTVLSGSGFTFQHPTLAEALRAELA